MAINNNELESGMIICLREYSGHDASGEKRYKHYIGVVSISSERGPSYPVINRISGYKVPWEDYPVYQGEALCVISREIIEAGKKATQLYLAMYGVRPDEIL